MGALGFTYSSGSAPTFTGTEIVHASAGVTWTFASAVTYGYYWNGDPFVVAGGSDITITAITPTYTTSPRIMNGTVVQPSQTRPNGFGDGTPYPSYNASLNEDPAKTGTNLVIAAAMWPTGASVVKSVGQDPIVAAFSKVDKYSVLTVVPSTPPVNAFRPPVYGTDKTSYYTLDDLDFTKLQNVTPVSGQAPISNFDYLAEATYVSWYQGSAGVRGIHPNAYRPDYNDTYLDNVIVPAMMAMHSDYTNAEKLNVYAGLVQQGIDYAAYNNAEGEWLSDSTHIEVFVPIMATAQVALQSSDIQDALDVARIQLFFNVQEADVGVEHFSDISSHFPSFATYQDVHVGMPEWRITPDNPDPYLNAVYRSISSDNAPVTALLMEMLGDGEGRTAVNDEAYFEYADRYRHIWDTGIPFPTDTNQPEDEWTAFVAAYFATYSSAGNFRPEAPTTVTASMSGSNIAVSISGIFPGSASVTQIDMRYKVAGGSWTTVTDFGTSGTISSPASGLYFVQARAVNSVGNGPWSDNVFTLKNTALSGALLAENVYTQAEVNAAGGLSNYTKTQAYEDNLRAVWEGDTGLEDVTNTYVTGTVIVP